jgi:hypothetical protein
MVQALHYNASRIPGAMVWRDRPVIDRPHDVSRPSAGPWYRADAVASQPR